MDWGYLVPIIFLVIWIITHVIGKSGEEEGPKRPGEPGQPRLPSEVDRFLQEINRRREEAEARKQ